MVVVPELSTSAPIVSAPSGIETPKPIVEPEAEFEALSPVHVCFEAAALPAANVRLKSAPTSPAKSNPNPVESENTLASDENESFDGEDQLSPMPGTFYSALTPEDEPFVSKGDVVKKGQVLCIIEAMKIMNEIESEFDGTVMKVNVNNGDPVEYNQPLFVIKPS